MGFYQVPSPPGYFSAYSFYLVCCVWSLLFAGQSDKVPPNCRVCSLWVGLDPWLVKVSWLGELVSVFWWMELDLISLESKEASNNEFWGVYVFGMALGNLSFSVHNCVPVLPD